VVSVIKYPPKNLAHTPLDGVGKTREEGKEGKEGGRQRKLMTQKLAGESSIQKK